jgi:hypothetical protein
MPRARYSVAFSPIFRPVSCQNALDQPRYPAKTTVSRRLITQTWRKIAGFAVVTQPSGRASPAAAFCGITEAG